MNAPEGWLWWMAMAAAWTMSFRAYRRAVVQVPTPGPAEAVVLAVVQEMDHARQFVGAGMKITGRRVLVVQGRRYQLEMVELQEAEGTDYVG